jgi:hypothetical protein
MAAAAVEMTEQSNLRGFATFLKAYMGVIPLVAAAFGPVLTLGRVLPIYEADRKLLATLSGLLGFLCFGFVFYNRHPLARALFSENTLPTGGLRRVADSIHSRILRRSRALALYSMPAVLIAAFVASLFLYQSQLEASVIIAQARDVISRASEERSLSDLVSGSKEISDTAEAQTVINRVPPRLRNPKTKILATVDSLNIPNHNRLIISYVAIFLIPEITFVLMALREYLQGILQITDHALIVGSEEKRS